MLFTLLLCPLEIFGDPFDDLLCFSRAEAFEQPFERIAIVFALIATINTVTRWNNIVGRIGPFLCHWYPMVLRQCMPQSLWASAIGARMFDVYQATLPIIQRKGGRQGPRPAEL